MNVRKSQSIWKQSMYPLGNSDANCSASSWVAKAFILEFLIDFMAFTASATVRKTRSPTWLTALSPPPSSSAGGAEMAKKFIWKAKRKGTLVDYSAANRTSPLHDKFFLTDWTWNFSVWSSTSRAPEHQCDLFLPTNRYFFTDQLKVLAQCSNCLSLLFNWS